MSGHSSQQTKQTLRTRIARQRRRIDHRFRGTQRAAGRLRDWKTYVRRFPIPAMLLAFGGGLLLSRGLPLRPASRWLAAMLVHQAWSGIKGGLIHELADVWAASQQRGEGRESAPHDAGRQDG